MNTIEMIIQDSMKTMIFYGDSNTYGYDPRFYIPGRYPKGVRWTSIVEQCFVSKAIVVAAGENGRSIPRKNSIEEKLLWKLLEKETPVDLLSIMLGSNDMLLYNASAETVARRMETLIERLRNRTSKVTNLSILLVAPVMLKYCKMEKSQLRTCNEMKTCDEIETCDEKGGERFQEAGSLFTEDAVARYQQEAKSLGRRYKEIAEKYSCFYMDANEWGIALGHDHVHFSEEGHRTYGEKMVQLVKEILEIQLV